jgi:hypothetical protein
MPKYQIPFTKVVHGYFEGEAKDQKEALEIYMEWDEFDNKSDYDVDEKNITEVKK